MIQDFNGSDPLLLQSQGCLRSATKNFTFAPIPQTPSPSSCLHLAMLSDSPSTEPLLRETRGRLFSVTKNPTLLHTSRDTYQTSQTSPLSSPNPIVINSPFSQTVEETDLSTQTAARKNPIALLLHATPLLSPTPSMPLPLSVRHLSPVQMILRAFINETWKRSTGPLWPKKTIQTDCLLLPQAQTETNPMIFSPARDPTVSPHYSPTRPQSQLISISPDDLVIQYPPLSAQQDPLLMDGIQNGSTVRTRTRKDSQKPTSGTANHFSTSSPLMQKKTQKEKGNKRKEKEKQHLLRRSPRLQARQRTEPDTPKHISKSGSQSSKIHFDLNFQETPLDINTTLTILQATGLNINKNVEEAIATTIKQDQTEDNVDQQRPSTPLHDPIPPLAIPGFDLLL